MNEFEKASARHMDAKAAFWKAERALAVARAELTIAERAVTDAFVKAIDAAERRVLSTQSTA